MTHKYADAESWWTHSSLTRFDCQPLIRKTKKRTSYHMYKVHRPREVSLDLGRNSEFMLVDQAQRYTARLAPKVDSGSTERSKDTEEPRTALLRKSGDAGNVNERCTPLGVQRHFVPLATSQRKPHSQDCTTVPGHPRWTSKVNIRVARKQETRNMAYGQISVLSGTFKSRRQTKPQII
ncbi:hypothetical protein DENSPDRAFT_66199 [Dentipellis sp. KUC8613]|nr:hypothetical protein DENSPDRAFT_66199 [Dentipellis sp. KUC8613]